MRYWIGLGANLGDRLAVLRAAADAVSRHGSSPSRSRVFAASPVGGPPQPPFLNAALAMECALEPLAMLAVCHELERQFGRRREDEARWGPRTLDLDLLLCGARGELVVSLPELEVPHPRLHERAFALSPLIDLDVTLLHPLHQRPLSALLSATQQRGDAVVATGDSL